MFDLLRPHESLLSWAVFGLVLIGLTISVSNAFLDTTVWQLEAERSLSGPIEKPRSVSGTPDTSNWKTYRNEQFGFEARYPLEWDYLDTGDSVEFRETGRDYFVEASEVVPIRISVYPSKSSNPLDHIRTQYQGVVTILQVDGVEAAQVQDYLGIEVAVVVRAKAYEISTPNFGDDQLNKKILGVRDRILSTFRFIELEKPGVYIPDEDPSVIYFRDSDGGIRSILTIQRVIDELRIPSSITLDDGYTYKLKRPTGFALASLLPDQKQFAFATLGGFGPYHIVYSWLGVFDMRQGTVGEVAQLGDGPPYDLAWSPNGQYLAMTLNGGARGVYSVAVAEVRTKQWLGGLREVIVANFLDKNLYTFRPTWSADGKQLFFESVADVGARPVRWSINLDGAGLQRLGQADSIYFDRWPYRDWTEKSLEDHCQRLGGAFNPCGSACFDPQEVCVQVCVPRCEFTTE